MIMLESGRWTWHSLLNPSVFPTLLGSEYNHGQSQTSVLQNGADPQGRLCSWRTAQRSRLVRRRRCGTCHGVASPILD
jgi:hypothetical protein